MMYRITFLYPDGTQDSEVTDTPKYETNDALLRSGKIKSFVVSSAQ